MSKNLSAILRTGSSTPITIASSTQLGGVKVDGTSIMISSSGVISGASTYSLPVSTSVILGGVKQAHNAIADNSEVYDAAAVEHAKEDMIAKLNAISLATTHEELDAIV